MAGGCRAFRVAPQDRGNGKNFETPLVCKTGAVSLHAKDSHCGSRRA
jgi:hypothetical protein